MNTTFENMSTKDLKKLRLDFYSKIFPSSVVTQFLFLIVFLNASLENSFDLIFTILTILAILSGAITFFVLTRKHRIDLKEKQVQLENKTIIERVYKLDYEPGSATVPVSLISILFFKKILMREMKELHIYYIIADDEKIYLDKEDFEKTEKGRKIFVRKAKQTGLYLGIYA